MNLISFVRGCKLLGLREVLEEDLRAVGHPLRDGRVVGVTAVVMEENDAEARFDDGVA